MYTKISDCSYKWISLSIADQLLASGLISSEVHQSLLVPSLSANDKAKRIVVGVTSMVQLNSRNT